MRRDRLVSFEGDWQSKRKRRTFAFPAPDLDLPAVGCDDLLGDGQSEPSPIPGMSAWHADEAIEDARQIFGRNSFARILD